MAEFAEVVRIPANDPRVRRTTDRARYLDDLVDLAARAPSAGKTQGWHLVVLEGDETAIVLGRDAAGSAA